MNQDELVALEGRIRAHRALKARSAWANLGRVYQGVYVGNRAELVGLLRAPMENDDRAVELIQNVRPPVVRERYEHQLVRVFHNYVAGTQTLVDHSRRLPQRYDGSGELDKPLVAG